MRGEVIYLIFLITLSGHDTLLDVKLDWINDKLKVFNLSSSYLVRIITYAYCQRIWEPNGPHTLRFSLIRLREF